MDDITLVLTIRVTEEQRDLIAAMWAHYNWELDILVDDGAREDIPDTTK